MKRNTTDEMIYVDAGLSDEMIESRCRGAGGGADEKVEFGFLQEDAAETDSARVLTGVTGDYDTVRAYLREINSILRLTPEEEVTLSKLAAAGDAEAKDRMIEANLRLVVFCAKRYMGRGLPFADLIEEGNLGLIQAVESFDPSKGYRFSTYGVFRIRRSIARAVVDKSRIIRVPVHMAEYITKVKHVSAKLYQRTGRAPEAWELAVEMGIPERKVHEILRCSADAGSLDAPVGEDEEAVLGDLVPDDLHPTPVQMAEISSRKSAVAMLLSLLNERESFVIRHRFGFVNDRVYTLEEIGRAMKISRERVRQIEASAIHKMGNSVYARKLIGYELGA